MSAYVEGRAHIDALVTLALEGPTGVPVSPMTSWHPPYFGDGRLTRERASELGRALIAENIKSVADRYPDDEPDDLPGLPIDKGELAAFRSYDYGDHPLMRDKRRRLTVPEAIIAISGYTYQTCEHDGWETSEVHAFMFRLLQLVASRVPGVAEADTWEVTS